MTAQQLINALSKLPPEKEVIIGIRQWNKEYNVISLPVLSTLEKFSYEMWINQHSGEITVHLPNKAFISKLPK